MRAYLEKPRTTIGWRGYLNDPNLDGSCDMIEGLRQSRRLLTALADCGIPLATELLDIAASAYYSDLISFAAIGARTAESQPHRALVSGLDIPAGFKNGTDGCLATAINGILAAAQGHAYFGLGEDGQACIMRTHGNSDTLMILRGGRGGPNYDAVEVAKAEEEMKRMQELRRKAEEEEMLRKIEEQALREIEEEKRKLAALKAKTSSTL
jgi:3-deoxy-7-phosphoheptulonate synthase